MFHICIGIQCDQVLVYGKKKKKKYYGIHAQGSGFFFSGVALTVRICVTIHFINMSINPTMNEIFL